MSNEITAREPSELSADINVITAEINAYQRVAGEAIFEIGRRLKHVKENDLTHGEFGKWSESIGMDGSMVRKFIRIVDELDGGKRYTYTELGMNALYHIATLPPEQREANHELADGSTKTPDEMTIRELRELKRKLKETEQREEVERKQRERLEEENEELRNKEPEHIESEPYDRTLDFPYTVQQGNDFYALMNEVDELYKKYANLKDGIDELRGIAKHDEDMQVKYRKASEFWRMLNDIFSSDDRAEVVDASYIEIN